MKPALHALAALFVFPALALAGGYDKPAYLAGEPGWLDIETGQWFPAPPENRPEFVPTGPVIYKISIAADPSGHHVTATHWSAEKPLSPRFEFTTLDGQRIRPQGWIRADWWNPETARKSDYGANPDALAVHLTDADRADIRSGHPGGRGGEGVPAPLLWIGAGLGLVFIFLTSKSATH